MDPDSLDTRDCLANALVEEGSSTEAKEEFAILGRSYAKRELLGKAIAAFQSAVRLDPEDTGLRRAMARVFALKGDVSAAITEMRKVEEHFHVRGDLAAVCDLDMGKAEVPITVRGEGGMDVGLAVEPGRVGFTKGDGPVEEVLLDRLQQGGCVRNECLE